MTKSLEYYHSLTNGIETTIDLTQDEASVALKIYDYGVEVLNEEEKAQLYRIVSKLKDRIWP
jgi:hypothetical protein